MSKDINMPVIQSLKTGIELLESIVKEDKALKFTDIEQITQMSKSNLHKYLNTLTLKGLLFRDQEGTYYLGSKLVEFGNAAIGSVNLIDLSSPHLKNISKKVQLTTLLAVWTNNGPIIGNIWNTHIGINIGAEIGSKLPALSSAGKTFLAFSDKFVVEEWKEEELKNISLEEQSSLEKEIEEVRKNKFTYSEEPLIQQISSFSLPILDYDNSIIGCVTVVGFNDMIPKTPTDPIVIAAKEEVLKISRIFGYLGE